MPSVPIFIGMIGRAIFRRFIAHSGQIPARG
jgi:hypothetical protein